MHLVSSNCVLLYTRCVYYPETILNTPIFPEPKAKWFNIMPTAANRPQITLLITPKAT
jgi:hypothetical protein